MKRISLAYPMTLDMPSPKAGATLEYTEDERVSKGDAGNTTVIHLWNHLGTHVDGPGHMIEGKGPLTEWIPAEGLVFSDIVLIDLPCDDSKLIDADMLKTAGIKSNDFDILLLRTGFGRYRQSDPDRYSKRNPGLSASGACFIKIND